MSTLKKTIVLGASTNPERYAYLATALLNEKLHPVVPVGIRPGQIAGIDIRTDRQVLTEVDTVTLYLNPLHQKDWYAYMLATQPRRVIFNPGSENPEFYPMLVQHGIDPVEACTLVMLRTGQY